MTHLRFVLLSDESVVNALSEEERRFARSVVENLSDLNQYQQRLRLRKYQLEILRSSELTIHLHGLTVRCSGTQYVAPKGYAYRFPAGARTIWLISPGFGWGYELEVVFVEETLTVYHTRPRLEEFRINQILKAAEHIAKIPDCEQRRTRLVVGHTNFAHFWYNELSAILEVEQELDKANKIEVIHENFVVIEQLIDFPKGAAIIKGNAGPNGLLENGSYYAGDLVFSLGAEVFTFAAKDRVRQRLQAHQDTLAQIGYRKERFCVWISLRAINRTPTNQEELILLILKSLNSIGINIDVLFDGYSEPLDVAVVGRYSLEKEAAARVITNEVARNLFEAARRLDLSNVRLINCTGFDLPASFLAARHADFYVCHHGTQQHKIAWLWDVPGVVHTNKKVAELLPARWVREHSEGSIAPEYLPVEFISDALSPPRDGQTKLYWGDYTLLHLNRVAELICERLISRMHALGYLPSPSEMVSRLTVRLLTDGLPPPSTLGP